MLNGKSISPDRRPAKADFASGDVVVIRFKNRNYSGIVDFSRDEETVLKQVESPLADFPTPDAGLTQVDAPPQSVSLSLATSVTLSHLHLS